MLLFSFENNDNEMKINKTFWYSRETYYYMAVSILFCVCTCTQDNFFKKFRLGSPIVFVLWGPDRLFFFVLWGPDRQIFSFCGARIPNFFRFVGPGSPTFFRFVGPDRQFVSFSGVRIANRNENGEVKIYTKTKTKYKSTCFEIYYDAPLSEDILHSSLLPFQGFLQVSC